MSAEMVRPRPRDERLDEHGRMRGSEAAMPSKPQTDLQRRIESELAMHHEVVARRNDQGDPMSIPEIDHELTMATGALEGLYQRVGALVAALGPVMPGDVATRLLNDEAFTRRNEDLEITTEVGQRIASVRRSISELEDCIGTLVASVRL